MVGSHLAGGMEAGKGSRECALCFKAFKTVIIYGRRKI
jgi:hypothetical protein